MSEERFPGELPESRESSLKIVLGLAGFVVVAGLLLCGGVAAYVAWVDTKTPVVENFAPVKDTAGILQVAAKIVDIDIPAGFEPISNESQLELSRVTFGRATDDGALLKLGRLNLADKPPGSDPRHRLSMLPQMIEVGQPRINTTFLPGSTSAETTRELTVLGRSVPFHFLRGTRTAGTAKVAKVQGAFLTKKGVIGVIFTIPETEYDEEAVVKMIESIRPAAGDAAPDDDTADDSATGAAPRQSGVEPGQSKPAKDAAPDDGQTLRLGGTGPDSP
jgi:hypothetical protein